MFFTGQKRKNTQQPFEEIAADFSPAKSNESKGDLNNSRTIHMRQSKTNHAFLQKRYREDEQPGEDFLPLEIPL